jgi:hypothetical protein
MRIQKYLDIDRIGYGYILTVKHTVNKKQEPVETIMQVRHLGPVDHWERVNDFSHLTTWPRAEESGDYQRWFDKY